MEEQEEDWHLAGDHQPLLLSDYIFRVPPAFPAGFICDVHLHGRDGP